MADNNERRSIDWSCKHDILIANGDGTYSRMDEPYFRSEQIAAGTWKVLSSGDYSYLIEGENEAVAVDTGYGAGNIREYLQTLTDKPVRNVINTHSHFDHTANNGYFEKAFMAKDAISRATIPFKSFDGIKFIQDYVREPIEEGFIYDLGGRSLEVFSIPDHTTDGIALLDRKERLLFTGDEFMIIGKNLKVSLQTFVGYLEKLLAHRSEFDKLCAGGGVLDASLLDSFYDCAKQILDGHPGEKCTFAHKAHELIKGENGEIIYDRIRPHPGDGGAGKEQQANAGKELYVMKYAGTSITYERDIDQC